MGFCFLNNVAVGAAHALTKYDCKKIAIVDFDVHHGNGTEAMFIDNPKVYFWSSFQHPFYPGAELNNKPSHIHLSPLEAGSTSAAFRDNVQSQLVPTLMQFKPECIFISAGFDAHIQDPLANLQLKTDDYFFVTKAICEVAEQFSQGRVISTLEGGYHLNALAESAVAHIKAML
jgi:acetoin utilization deacetylase AcuC-like enzyme